MKAILLTHAHYDHIGALDDIISKYDVPVYMHQEEFDFYKIQKNGASKFKQYGMPQVISYAKPSKLEEGSKEIEGFNLTYYTPRTFSR